MESASSITVSAPGSIMLLGEHAVLHGRRALVAAVDQRLRVTASVRADRRVRVRSDLGAYDADLDHLQPHPEFRFVLSAVEASAGRLTQGLDLVIEADFPPTVGLGSSAAVTAATGQAINVLTGSGADARSLQATCLDAVRRVQGAASGADLAASCLGGVIAYRAEPREFLPCGRLPPVTVVYSGGKTPTPEVIRRVESRRRETPRAFEKIFDAMDASIDPAVRAIDQGNWAALGRILNESQARMCQLGVSSTTLDDIVARLRGAGGIFGAKISGAGLGDCVVGIGSTTELDGPYPRIAVSLSAEGVRID